MGSAVLALPGGGERGLEQSRLEWGGIVGEVIETGVCARGVLCASGLCFPFLSLLPNLLRQVDSPGGD